jgi:hypothetical protein
MVNSNAESVKQNDTRTQVSPKNARKSICWQADAATRLGRDLCSLDMDMGIWDAVARSNKDGQVTVAVVNFRDKTYQVHKGDVIGSFRNREESGEELVPLDDEIVASIFREI